MNRLKIDDRRNALSSLESDCIENAGLIVEAAFKMKGFTSNCYIKRIGQYTTFRIELNDCPLVQEVKSLLRSEVTLTYWNLL